MRFQKNMRLFLALCIVCTLFIGSVSASWAYMFVVNDGKIYVITEERVEPSQIGSNHVKQFVQHSELSRKGGLQKRLIIDDMELEDMSRKSCES